MQRLNLPLSGQVLNPEQHEHVHDALKVCGKTPEQLAAYVGVESVGMIDGSYYSEVMKVIKKSQRRNNNNVDAGRAQSQYDKRSDMYAAMSEYGGYNQAA